MRRRHLLQSVAAGSVVTTAAACQSAPETDIAERRQPVVNWRMATSWPKFLSVFEGIDILCQRVGEMTAGRFTITPYEGGALAPPLELFDVVSAGEVECGHTVTYYYMDKSPTLAFSTSVPFGFSTQQQNAWLYSGGGIEAIQTVLDPFNLIWFHRWQQRTMLVRVDVKRCQLVDSTRSCDWSTG